MTRDPYEVLGVSQNATNEEVKRAYREMSRKYHPDNVADNPLRDLAEEKFKEVQDAYKQIMDMREHGSSGSYTDGFGTGGNGSTYTGGSSDDMMRFNSVRTYINNRRYSEALSALSGISNRSAEWHYLYAVTNAGMGNNMEAMNHAQQAVSMAPNNMEYKNFLNQMQFRGTRYQTGSAYGGRQQSFGTGNLCCDLWCADTLCECMGGDLCSCM